MFIRRFCINVYSKNPFSLLLAGCRVRKRKKMMIVIMMKKPLTKKLNYSCELLLESYGVKEIES